MWTSHESKTHKKTYYVHEASGRQQWEPPDQHYEDDKEKIQEYFTNRIHMYSPFITFLKSAICHELQYYLCDVFDDTTHAVLDVGCGKLCLDKKWWNGWNYLGMDVFPVLDSNSIVGDMSYPTSWKSIPPCSIDMILFFDSLQLCWGNDSDKRSILKDAKDKLTKNGCILILSKEENATDYREGWRDWKITTKEIKKICKELQLTQVSCTNLASLASFLGVNTSRLTQKRNTQWLTHHSSMLMRTVGRHLTHKDWSEASSFCVRILQHSGAVLHPPIVQELEDFCLSTL